MTILPILLLFLIVGMLFYGGYKQRRDRTPASTDTEVVIVGDSSIMMTKREIAEFIFKEKIRRNIVKNKSAYKAMKPRKWRIGSWSK